MHAGFPDAARRVRDAAPQLAARALAVALERDKGLRERNDEIGRRARLHDAELLAERVALAVGAGDAEPIRTYAEGAVAIYRRKGVSLDDLIALCDGLQVALPDVLAPNEMPAAQAGLDAAIAVFKWHRRLAGDARKKNAFLQFLYKGG